MPHSTYLPERMGSATIDPRGRFEAGSFQSFTLTCTAGYFASTTPAASRSSTASRATWASRSSTIRAHPTYVTAEASTARCSACATTGR